ncbi:hypothetical protein GCM10007938_42240 [Vibrio zhanjiangensis]|uniref:Uncharacterized protein n=1 Tax=Vibrio zhanjiangensis TaxID=1046128 RepID=A0ABQ6F5A6_9VIBR|nr:hypothetical protein [Vibrio zhanjiangensis]GLT20439.1 hypothetical protein GCM10007938_42240 [Vibrio zhanjiangensis]
MKRRFLAMMVVFVSFSGGYAVNSYTTKAKFKQCLMKSAEVDNEKTCIKKVLDITGSSKI